MTLAPGRQNVHSVRQNDDDDDVSTVELFADVHKQQTYAEADAAVADDATAFCLFDVRAPKSVQHTNTKSHAIIITNTFASALVGQI